MTDIATDSVASWNTDPVLTVEHLTMRFGGLVAINDLSFNVGRGDITALIGPNGAGKTTVFNCVTGFYKPTEGRIVMRHGTNVPDAMIDEVTQSGRQWKKGPDHSVFLLERMPDFRISEHARVARTFQNIRLFGGMTVLENLLIAQHNPLMRASKYTIGGILGLASYKHAEDEAIAHAAEWLRLINLVERADDPAADLPYGAQRRLEIARAMCTNPQLLCLDEPAAGLNPRESAELNELLQVIRGERGTSVLLIEHDMGVVMEISDHIVVLDYGEKISDGDANHVKSDPKVIAAYLGVEDEDEIDDPIVLQDLKSVSGAATETSDRPPAGENLTSLKPVDDAPSPIGEKSVSEKPPLFDRPHGEKADNLTRIKGIGRQYEKKLNALGVWHFNQIAGWSDREVQWIGDSLAFPGRIEREEWVRQAALLAEGGQTEFSARVDKGEVPTSKFRSEVSPDTKDKS